MAKKTAAIAILCSIFGGSVFLGTSAYAQDADGDGVADTVDNCTLVANPAQTDGDNDNIGNQCDGDLNNDCSVNVVDLGIFRTRFFTADPAADFNDDGIANILDLGLLRTFFFAPPGPSAAGCDAGTNEPGTIAVSGITLVGETLTAAVTDPNGTGVITYEWAADGVVIDGATESTYSLTSAERGAVITVTATYVDNDGFSEGPITATADDIVFSAIVTGETTLLAAALAASEGDVIGLASADGGDDYADMAEVAFTSDNLVVRLTAGSTAVISGATCIVLGGDGMVVDGLVFDALDWIMGGACDSNGDGSVYLSGDGVTLRNSQFLGEAEPRTVPSGDPYHFITVKGFQNVIERNLFQGKDMDNEGSIISLFADANPMNNEGSIIQYNLFKDILGKTGVTSNRNSTAHALQIGRSTGGDSLGEGLHIVRHNRFDSVESERRLMRVQSGGNTIEGNTVVNSLGLIALEDGYASSVMRNVILSGGEDNDDGGISFAPLGHTVTDNYVNNMRTTSSQRGALLINPDPLSGSGNTTLLGTPGLDFTVTVARNTVVNARQAVLFEDADCTDLDPILDFDNNLVMNQSSGASINMNTNGVNRTVVNDEDWDLGGCAIDPTSDFDNNHFYSATLAEGTFNFNGAAADNVVGGEDGATFVQDADGLVNGSGPDAGIGVDTSILNLIDESQVGPGSTWTAPASAFSTLVNEDLQSYVETDRRTLDSDGPDQGLSAYDLIRNLGGANAIESPDLYSVNHPGVEHIYEATTAGIGPHFVFIAHRDIDIDRDRLDITDRQRNEIKTYGPSEDAVKGFENETMAFQWKFQINSDMEVSRNFSHFFQLKAVGGDDSQPILTLTGNERSDEDGMEIRHSPLQATTILDRIDWAEVTGEWVEVYCRATFADNGSLRLIAQRMSDQQIMFDVSETAIDMWRGEQAQDFVRPKWGIYRSLLDASNLRPDEESVRFANFTIRKLQAS
ncbi:MAG: chondroitinase-B domain-containing protein [Gammaproteobacteria bacterium]